MKWYRIVIVLIALCFVLGLVHHQKREIDLKLDAFIYENGNLCDRTSVKITGSKGYNANFDKETFVGRICFGCLEITNHEQIQAMVIWVDPIVNSVIIDYSMNATNPDVGILSRAYMAEDMTKFAVYLNDGRVIATSDKEVAELEKMYELRKE